VEVALGELLFDVGLTGEEPVQGLVQVVLGGLGHLQFFGQSGGVPEPRGGELGARVQEAFGDHGHDEVALARGLGCQQQVEAEAAHGAEDGLDVAVGEIALHDKGLRSGKELLAGEGAANEVDEVGRQVGDIAEGFVLDLGADAEGAAEEVGLVDLAFVRTGCGGHMNLACSGWHR
jgi:hypothetical protein